MRSAVEVSGQLFLLPAALSSRPCPGKTLELTGELVVVAIESLPGSMTSPRLVAVALALHACLSATVLGHSLTWSRCRGRSGCAGLFAVWVLGDTATQSITDRPVQLVGIEVLAAMTMRVHRAPRARLAVELCSMLVRHPGNARLRKAVGIKPIAVVLAPGTHWRTGLTVAGAPRQKGQNPDRVGPHPGPRTTGKERDP